eukprot:NODE_24067_length_639_cov_3.812500.p7 GENE.NODE_24067_length_639_cov_3.812500~~NODE_24067_length_639_cov_3.812500.p7  ORF type:complete len:50 (+),score=7.07 NODE_24067_length_639_cov_3.812500:249-398(+)
MATYCCATDFMLSTKNSAMDLCRSASTCLSKQMQNGLAAIGLELRLTYR